MSIPSPETSSPSSPMSKTHKVTIAFESIVRDQRTSNDGDSTHTTPQVSSHHRHEPMATIASPPPTAAEMDLLRFNLLRQFPNTKVTLKPTMHLRDGSYRHECQLKFYYLKPCASLNSYPSCRRFSESKLLPSLVVLGNGDTRDAAEADVYRKASEMAHAAASQYNDDDDDNNSTMIRVKDCDKSGMWCTLDNTDNARELAVLACYPNTAMQIVMIRCVDESGQRPEKYRCDLYFAYAVRNPVQMHWTILSHAFIVQGRGMYASAWEAISAVGKQALEPFLPITTDSEFEEVHDDSIAVKAPKPVLPPHILLSTHHHAVNAELAQNCLSAHNPYQHSVHDTTAVVPSRPPSTLPPTTPQQPSHYYQSLGLGQSMAHQTPPSPLPRSTQTFGPIANTSNEGVNNSSPTTSHDEIAEHVDYISMLYQCKHVCGITFQMLDATGSPHAPTHRCQLTCGILITSPTIQYRSVIAHGATVKEARHAAAKTMMTRYVLLLMAMNP